MIDAGKNPPTPFWNGGRGKCRPASVAWKKGGLVREVGCFQSAQNFGPGDLNRGRADACPFSFPLLSQLGAGLC